MARCITIGSEHIAKIAHSLTDWRTLVPYLGLNEADAEEIERNGRNEPEKRRRVLRMWINRNGAKATYKQLIAAFELCDRICENPALPTVLDISVSVISLHASVVPVFWKSPRDRKILQIQPISSL